MDWNDPAQRALLAEQLGVEGYNAAFEKARQSSVVAETNGYQIMPVQSRWGRLFMIDGTVYAYATLAQAEAAARLLKPGPPKVRR